MPDRSAASLDAPASPLPPPPAVEPLSWRQRFHAWRERRRAYLNRPVEECPHCGHAWIMGNPHDDVACELKQIRAILAGLDADFQ